MGRQKITGAELVARALSGSEDAFRILVDQYQRPVFGLIVRMVRDRGLAEDLPQDVFLKAYKALGSYDADRKFSSWLFKIAHNATIDHLRRSQLATVPLVTDDPERADLVDVLEDEAALSPDRVAASSDLGRALDESIRQLRLAYREVVLLRHRDELSYQEIADIMGASLGTIKTNLHRARKELMVSMRERGLAADDD
ncbi:MAG: sigma-70 family RNA polymerase sigma factor [Acidobacteriota bacterium]|nr:sigma-70 family RNA polymerase sigma factor [Acidobacteriota bacterium]